MAGRHGLDPFKQQIERVEAGRVAEDRFHLRIEQLAVLIYAGGLILEAATSNGPIGKAAAQLTRALRADGFFDMPPLRRRTSLT
jgi:hypothetical protein